MKWKLKLSSFPPAWAQKRLERGQHLPGLGEEPAIPEGLTWIEDAFWELSSDRAVGFGAGSIPFGSIDRYAERYEVDDFDEFLYLIRAADRAYLEFQQDKKGPTANGGHRPQSKARRPRSGDGEPAARQKL